MCRVERQRPRRPEREGRGGACVVVVAYFVVIGRGAEIGALGSVVAQNAEHDERTGRIVQIGRHAHYVADGAVADVELADLHRRRQGGPGQRQLEQLRAAVGRRRRIDQRERKLIDDSAGRIRGQRVQLDLAADRGGAGEHRGSGKRRGRDDLYALGRRGRERGERNPRRLRWSGQGATRGHVAGSMRR